jgi:tetratricopeptide (TPR) repeat protein
MSSPIAKSVRRSGSRSASRISSPRSAAKTRARTAKSARPKPKQAAAAKAPARKATKATAKKAVAAVRRKGAPVREKTGRKSVSRKPIPPKAATAMRQRKAGSALPRVKKTQIKQTRAVRAQKPTTPPVPRQPTLDESAALRAFERARREFSRGRFAEARNQFRALLERYSQVSEVAARSRTYLSIVEARLRTESILPRDADSLYDRGVIELNRGEYVAAQEMFERALKREPEAAHIHYGLAATRARLGSIDLALQSLQRALDLQPNLRVRAQHDQDLTPLRSDPDFDRLVFASRA